jgi:hypothetical protein
VKPLQNDARPSVLHAPEAALTLHNRLPEGHRYRLGLEGALRAGRGDLSGPLDGSVYPVGRACVSTDVVAPHAWRWRLAGP